MRMRELDLRMEVTSMDRKKVSYEIKKTIKRLNRKMKKLESSGYDRYSTSYSRLRDVNEATSGTHYFSSAHVRNASLKERQEFLYRLKTYESFKGLTKEDIIESFEKTASKLSKGDLQLTSADIMKINDFMSEWREFIMHSNIAELMTSDEIREIITEHRDMTRSDFDKFMKELEKFNTGTYRKDDFDVFIQSYDFEKGRPIATSPNGIPYNPMNGRIYSDDYKYLRTSVRLSRSGEELVRWDSGKKRSKDIGIKISSFNKESFYDYIFNNKNKK